MSSSTKVSNDPNPDYSFGTSGQYESGPRFIYGMLDESREDQIDLVVDRKGGVGWYHSSLSELELVNGIKMAEDYCKEQDLDPYGHSFRERSEEEWEHITEAVLENSDEVTDTENNLTNRDIAIRDFYTEL